MRKYIKPVIIMEDFLLTESVAAGCDANVFDTMGNCANNVEGYDELKFMGVFTSDERCKYTSGQFDLSNGKKICLHGSTGTNVFSS